MSASNYLEDEILDHILGAATFTPPATVYVSLHDGDPGETGANEVSGTNYARVSVTNNSTNWPAASGGAKSNGTAIEFPTPGSGGWGTVTHFGIWDASTDGNLLFAGALTTPKAINEGDDPVEFAIGALDVTAD